VIPIAWKIEGHLALHQVLLFLISDLLLNTIQNLLLNQYMLKKYSEWDLCVRDWNCILLCLFNHIFNVSYTGSCAQWSVHVLTGLGGALHVFMIVLG
jgi:hypothetical protein